MASSYDSFKDLNLTRDEVDRLTDALKNKEFRKLFVDYVEELNDPENKKIFQREVTELEKERGIDVTFINPIPGYVIKTSVDGNRKAFINICSNEHIQPPTSTPTYQSGTKGLTWSIPHSASPPRDDYDNKKIKCRVFDVVFHPDTLHLAQKNEAFRNMVNKTACETIETNFNENLDTKNLKFPKMKYKGALNSSVIREASEQNIPEKSEEEQAILDKIFEKIPQFESPVKKNRVPKVDDDSKYTIPKYLIKHRSHIELENFTYDRTAKMNSAIPKELVIEVNLPLLKAATDIQLDVTERSVQLLSEKPKYKLSLTLPYQVHKDEGNAKFDKDLKKLCITLPVQRNNPFIYDTKEDSGVESDHGSPISTTPDEEPQQSQLEPITFLSNDIEYSVPEYIYQVCNDCLNFTLQVKNVNEDSIEKVFNSVGTSVHVKFNTISSGFYPVHYSFYIKLPEHFIQTEQVCIEAWDNNVILQIPYKPSDHKLAKFLVGLHEENSSEVNVVRLDVINNNVQEQVLEPIVENPVEEVIKPKVQKANVVLDTVPLREEPVKSRAIDIVQSLSESSGDDMSSSYSPRCKGILKRISSSRSVSESSIDDAVWASSFENCYKGMDSVIPEDGVSSSLKKTVRFNDNVTRQVFRLNSSILGQKKKNQKKAKNKKRAQERRNSESELSDTARDGRKERETKAGTNPTSDKKEEAHIFEFDM